jgi:hypothetical protein
VYSTRCIAPLRKFGGGWPANGSRQRCPARCRRVGLWSHRTGLPDPVRKSQ